MNARGLTSCLDPNVERGLSVVFGVLIRLGDNPRGTIGNSLEKRGRQNCGDDEWLHNMDAYQVENLSLKNEGVQRIYNLLN